MMYSTQPYSTETPAPSLALSGNNGYEIQGDRVIITASEIANNRDAGNISGTLSIELWALNQPYQGGDFSGIAMAGTQIGEMLGQHYLADCRYDLSFNEPPAGTWYFTLMLREWTGSGYVTRDYVNFAQPYVVNKKPAVVQSKADNVINVTFPGMENAPTPAVRQEEPVLKPIAKEPAVAKTSTKGKTGKKSAKDDKAVSLNQASVHDLAALKGMSMKLAESIVASRPFTSVEEILHIKGMGPKLLDKLHKFIKL